MAVFGRMAAKRVGQLRALPDQQFAGAEQHGARLLIGGFDSDRPHRRPLRRLDACATSKAPKSCSSYGLLAWQKS